MSEIAAAIRKPRRKVSSSRIKTIHNFFRLSLDHRHFLCHEARGSCLLMTWWCRPGGVPHTKELRRTQRLLSPLPLKTQRRLHQASMLFVLAIVPRSSSTARHNWKLNQQRLSIWIRHHFHNIIDFFIFPKTCHFSLWKRSFFCYWQIADLISEIRMSTLKKFERVWKCCLFMAKQSSIWIKIYVHISYRFLIVQQSVELN